MSYKYSYAFVIVTYNAEIDINNCIDSVLKNISSDENYIIAVVDNNSTDNTREILKNEYDKYEKIKFYFLDENIGFGRANNHAMSQINAEYYFLLNADAWLLRSETISDCIDACNKDSNIAICGVPLIYPDGTPQTYAFRFPSFNRWLLHVLHVKKIVNYLLQFRIVNLLFGHLSHLKEYIASQNRAVFSFENIDLYQPSKEVREVEWVSGAAMILKDTFVKEKGGFDEEIFLYGEDADLCIAAHENNLKVIVVDTIPVVHKLGWGKHQLNLKVANMKYNSLKYSIKKNIKNKLEKQMMLCLLPLYVYGWKYIFKAYRHNKIRKEKK